MTIDERLLHIYTSTMPKGTYHKRDDQPGVIFRNGSPCLELRPPSHEADLLAGALVYLLNARDE